MLVAIPAERREHETRVAATPESCRKLKSLGLEVALERGAGERAYFSDEEYAAEGVRIEEDAAALLGAADLVLKVQRPLPDELRSMKPGTVLIGMLAPHGDEAGVRAYAEQRVDAFALEFLPRISRAQSMDVLSSQSNLAGYRAVIDAAATFSRAMPMMMTAAGTVAPARVMVLGAGVAGLQAIATARRLGAIVSATDVRPAAREQVESLGANFVMVQSEESGAAETAGGYAREMSEDYRRRQAELVAETLKKQDIVICTALIPGRPAPRLVSDAMLASMKRGSVVVDLAVEQGGNCEGSRPGEVVTVHGVEIVGHLNVPGRLAVDASALYARNLFNFLAAFTDAASGTVQFDWDDELVKGVALTRGGEVIHPLFAHTPTAEEGS